jgi:hypothetical protein
MTHSRSRLQINPYYGKTSMSGLRAHFQALLKEGPAIIYNVPGRTGQDIPEALVHEMAQHPNFLGMKECTGNKRIGGYTSQVGQRLCLRLGVCLGVLRHAAGVLPMSALLFVQHSWRAWQQFKQAGVVLTGADCAAWILWTYCCRASTAGVATTMRHTTAATSLAAQESSQSPPMSFPVRFDVTLSQRMVTLQMQLLWWQQQQRRQRQHQGSRGGCSALRGCFSCMHQW